jgi:hypothetical protein
MFEDELYIYVYQSSYSLYGSVSCEAKKFTSSSKCPDLLWSKPCLLFNGYRGQHPLKWPSREVDHQPHAAPRLIMHVNISYSSSIRHGTQRDKFTSTSTLPLCTSRLVQLKVINTYFLVQTNRYATARCSAIQF